MFFWDADPLAFSIGPVNVYWYGLLFASGFILGYLIMNVMFKQKGYDTSDLDRLLTFMFLGTIIGARLGHCLIYDPQFYLSHPAEILKIWKGGLASHGGTVGVTLAVIYCLRTSKRKYNFFEIADMLTVPTALVCSFIRIGNFMNSEILGHPTRSDFGVIFARLGETFPRYPAQLFEAAAYFAVFILLTLIYVLRKNRIDGLMLSLMIFLVFTARLLIEPFKEEQAAYSTGSSLTVGQLLSVPFILSSVALAIFLIARHKKRTRQ